MCSSFVVFQPLDLKKLSFQLESPKIWNRRHSAESNYRTTQLLVIRLTNNILMLSMWSNIAKIFLWNLMNFRKKIEKRRNFKKSLKLDLRGSRETSLTILLHIASIQSYLVFVVFFYKTIAWLSIIIWPQWTNRAAISMVKPEPDFWRKSRIRQKYCYFCQSLAARHWELCGHLATKFSV